VVASRDSMRRRAEEGSRATGQSLDEAAAVVVEDLERAATALSARTAPLVPACGVLVAVAGLLLKVGPSSDGIAEFFLGFAVLSAVLGLSFLARAHFIYAGRRTIGLSPTVDDIDFAGDRLVRKQACTHRGGWLAAIALACLVVGILAGVRITLGAG
jgi:hypothetical protein